MRAASAPGPDSTTPADKSNRLDSIDVLRGLAALSVGLFHLWGHDGTYPWPSYGVVKQSADPHLLSYLTSPMRWGFLGVSLFLVLSGFCIHLPLARRKAKSGSYGFSAKEFYLRRMWRLYPAYFVAVIVAVVMLFIGNRFFGQSQSVPSLADIAIHLTMLHGVFEHSFYTIVSVFWSLALEFQLYLAYPLFLLLFRKFGVTKSVLGLTALGLIARWLLLNVFGYGLITIGETPPFALMGSVLARAPEWLFGVWLAEYYVTSATTIAPSTKRLLDLGFVAFFATAILSALRPEFWVLTDPLFGLGFTMLIAARVLGRQKQRTSEGRLYRFFVWMGVVSYSFYLFHLPISWIGNAFISRVPGIWIPFALRTGCLLLTIPIIGILFNLVERPFLSAPKPSSALFRPYQSIRKLLGLAPLPF